MEYENQDCPFLRSVVADQIWIWPTAVYCRVPSGRVRILTPQTVSRYCIGGGYRDCPSYRLDTSGEGARTR